ncbi:putative N-acetylated-alpha-linked acidic dipeptidase 2 [Apostichopus japonicus]|uniref:Putative N-acetylated-alpha-linked acidic dipeptidase 2 n=1 Tax=Stichopus japonicus TaxID=307972 RepID=A0A2G8KQF9_STIJA|nr:putative N-acetylated-alpha-linked acidic dipeptidase 2 [Apostichopus japonicus]
MVAEPHPSETRKTLYDSVVERLGVPPDETFFLVDGGTDFEAFVYSLGIPAINAYYHQNWEDVHGLFFYSLYHTHYETFRLVDEFIDEGFLCHRATGQFFAEMIRNIAESNIVNSDVTQYFKLIEHQATVLRNDYLERIIENDVRNISFDFLSAALEGFEHSANNFQYTILPAVDTDNPLAVRAINDQMMSLERVFISRELLPGEPVYRHTIIGPSSLFDNPARTFPGIVLALKDIDDDPDQEKRWSEVERQVVMLTQALQEATEVLKDFTSW